MIATSTKKAFEAGQIFSADKRNNQTAEFWVRAMWAHTTDLRAKQPSMDIAQFCGQLEEYVQRYFRFVSQRLLFVADLGGARQIAQHLAVVKEVVDMRCQRCYDFVL